MSTPQQPPDILDPHLPPDILQHPSLFPSLAQSLPHSMLSQLCHQLLLQHHQLSTHNQQLQQQLQDKQQMVMQLEGKMRECGRWVASLQEEMERVRDWGERAEEDGRGWRERVQEEGKGWRERMEEVLGEMERREQEGRGKDKELQELRKEVEGLRAEVEEVGKYRHLHMMALAQLQHEAKCMSVVEAVQMENKKLSLAVNVLHLRNKQLQVLLGQYEQGQWCGHSRSYRSKSSSSGNRTQVPQIKQQFQHDQKQPKFGHYHHRQQSQQQQLGAMKSCSSSQPANSHKQQLTAILRQLQYNPMPPLSQLTPHQGSISYNSLQGTESEVWDRLSVREYSEWGRCSDGGCSGGRGERGRGKGVNLKQMYFSRDGGSGDRVFEGIELRRPQGKENMDVNAGGGSAGKRPGKEAKIKPFRQWSGEGNPATIHEQSEQETEHEYQPQSPHNTHTHNPTPILYTHSPSSPAIPSPVVSSQSSLHQQLHPTKHQSIELSIVDEQMLVDVGTDCRVDMQESGMQAGRKGALGVVAGVHSLWIGQARGEGELELGEMGSGQQGVSGGQEGKITSNESQQQVGVQVQVQLSLTPSDPLSLHSSTIYYSIHSCSPLDYLLAALPQLNQYPHLNLQLNPHLSPQHRHPPITLSQLILRNYPTPTKQLYLLSAQFRSPTGTLADTLLLWGEGLVSLHQGTYILMHRMRKYMGDGGQGVERWVLGNGELVLDAGRGQLQVCRGRARRYFHGGLQSGLWGQVMVQGWWQHAGKQ